ncbi:MAG: hypothetical protein IJT61_03120 [Bacteroidales bacterium]|nr:hypothetical protein [Bacteroidales bacterium]MBR0077178.1 hypothetical protein [Bacteroidales bacterium]
MEQGISAFNPMQIQLLRMFSYAKTEEEMKVIQSALCDYFFKKVEEGMDSLEMQGLWGKEQSEAVLHEHLRTPYNN